MNDDVANDDVSTTMFQQYILDYVASKGSDESSFHALIDTGALVTGLSNLAVAQYLLRHGLNGIEGVVFLDEEDRKMICVRKGYRVSGHR